MYLQNIYTYLSLHLYMYVHFVSYGKGNMISPPPYPTPPIPTPPHLTFPSPPHTII